MGSESRLLDAARARRVALRAAMAALEETLAGPAQSSGWAGRVSRRVREVAAAWESHAAEVEAPDGLLAEIERKAPRLTRAVAELRTEHETLGSRIGRALEACSALPDALEAARAPEVRQELVQILLQLIDHRQRGADLIYEAYHVDIGGE